MRLKLLWIAFVWVLGVQPLTAEMQCPHIPVSAAGGDGLSFVDLEFDPLHSLAHLQIRNATSHPLTDVFVLAELYDSTGFVAAVPFYSGDYQPRELRGPFYREWLDLHNHVTLHSVMPGSTFVLVGDTRNLLAACPNHARIAIEELSSAGHVIYSATSGWELEPYILDATYFRPDTCTTDLPYEVVFTIATDKSLRPLLKETSQPTPRLRECIQKQLDHWRIAPDIRDGVFSESTFAILFRIHSASGAGENNQMAEPRTEHRIMGIIDAYPDTKLANGWYITYGGSWASHDTLRPRAHQ